MGITAELIDGSTSQLSSITAMDQIPVASCLLSDHSERVVLHANKEFYQLIGCSKDEFQYRFGGRLSAVTTGEWPESQLLEDGQSLRAEQRICIDGAEKWLRISVRRILISGKARLLCTLTDISAEKNTASDFAAYKSVFERASLLAGSETFAYDLVTQRAVIYHKGDIFEQISPEDQERFGSFQQAIIEKGLVDQADESALKTAFASIRRKEASVCEVRMRTITGRRQWMRLSIELKALGSRECETAVGILQNITELKAANLHCLGEAQFLQAILSEKNSYIQVDLSTDKILRVGGQWFLYSGLIHSTGYRLLLTDCLSSSIYSDDVPYYLEFMNPENLLQALDSGINQLSCRIRRTFEENDIGWIQIKAFLFQNPFSQDIEALICSERLDKSNAWTSVPVQKSPFLPNDGAPAEAQGDLEQSFEHFMSENGEISYLVNMDTFELLAGNETLYRRVGLTKSECAGKTCYWIMHRRNSPCPFCGRENWSKNKFYIWKNWNAVFQQDFLIKNKIVNWQGRDVLLAIAVDVSRNKSFLDTVDDGGGESHSVLAGIRRMSEAGTLAGAIRSALETIGSFFSAGAVQYWAYSQKEETFSCGHEWKLTSTFLDDPGEQRVFSAVNQWVHKHRWTYPVDIENQEAMLCHSFEMYNLLKESGIWNQRWVPLREGENLWGILVIMNIANHFHNTSFLNTLSVFMLEEWRNKTKLDELIYANNHDELTGFPNRKDYERYLDEFTPDSIKTLGVVSANINNLEEINKQQGFSVGDDCVRHFAAKLQSAFEEGRIYRLNGGEFIVILPDFSREKLAARLEELEDEAVSCRRYSLSTGYSWDNIEKELPVLVRQASQSMRFNREQQFDTAGIASDEERQSMLQGLMRSLGKQEFEVFLQPKVNLFTGKIMGAEALVRYRDQAGQIIPPSRFIDVLEKNNLIRFVDFYVFEECCRILEKWQGQGFDLPTISFNFSRLTLLERDIVGSVQSIFSKYSIPKEHAEIEITESVADLGKGVLYQAAHELYQAGFSISLDDFGTKYTNLDILSELDFDMLKVDKSLVSQLTKRRSNQIILQNIITMCKHLNISVIAEGVETKAQEDILRSLGCRYGQGYLFGRPMPIPEFEEKFMQGPNFTQ